MKKNPRLKASTNGNRASNHISAQLFANSAKVKYKAIPYGGTADQLLALRQGEVDFSCPKIADVASMIHGDKPELRALGIFDTKRDAALPNVPTLKELGYYPEWYGSARAIVLPKGAQPEIVKFYADAFLKTMQDKECAELHHKAGFNMDYKNPKELADLIQAQINFCQPVNLLVNVDDCIQCIKMPSIDAVDSLHDTVVTRCHHVEFIQVSANFVNLFFCCKHFFICFFSLMRQCASGEFPVGNTRAHRLGA